MAAGSVLVPWQRFLRFRVRGLILMVLVIGAGLGWLGRSAQIQREAVAAIKNARGSVAYDSHRIRNRRSVQHDPSPLLDFFTPFVVA
jgi:hypothetical protein